jgi:hypothetical protein
MKIKILVLALFMTVGLSRVNTQPHIVNCQFTDGECGCYMWPEGNMYECFGAPYGSSSLGNCRCAPPSQN